MKYIIAVIALMVSAVGAQAATDWTITLTKVNNEQLRQDSSPKANGLAYDRLVVLGPETPTRSKHIIPLDKVTAIATTGRQFGKTTWYAGAVGGTGGGGGGKLRGPALSQRERVVQENGANYVETITTYADSMTWTSEPQASGVIAPSPLEPIAASWGELTVTVTQEGGPNNHQWSGYKVWCPRLLPGSNVSVGHNYETGAYYVTSISVTIGAATITYSGYSVSVTLPWFQDAKDH